MRELSDLSSLSFSHNKVTCRGFMMPGDPCLGLYGRVCLLMLHWLDTHHHIDTRAPPPAALCLLLHTILQGWRYSEVTIFRCILVQCVYKCLIDGERGYLYRCSKHNTTQRVADSLQVRSKRATNVYECRHSELASSQASHPEKSSFR